MLFLIVIVVSLFSDISVPVICGAFLFASVFKAALSYFSRIPTENYIEPHTKFNVVLQQLLNFALFRSDQILIFTFLFSSAFFAENTVGLNSVIYLTKYPELINGILTAVWVLYLPALTADFAKSVFLFVKKHFLFLAGLVIAIVCTGVYHYHFGHFSIVHPLLLYSCFFVNAVLGIPTNMVTYHFLKSGKIDSIIRLSVIALLAGLLLFLISFYLKQPLVFVWIVPLQLGLYTFIFIWKRRIA